jgi:hypothetical protein
MLKANVGLSRKISRDYQSTGYTVNIEGEILGTVDDPETVLGRVQELFSLANEALNQEIDRDQGDQAIGRRDEGPAPPPPPSQPSSNGNSGRRESPPPEQRQAPPSQNGARNDEPITNKQAQFLHGLGKRQRLSAVELEAEIERIIGRRAKVYDLSKREAGKVIDALTKNEQANGRPANQRA